MTLLQVYEYTLGELNKREAPSLLLEDFNYFLNKAIQQHTNKIYNVFELTQQQTDDLRILKKTSTLSLDDDGVATLPDDYRHMLSCRVNFEVTKAFNCYTVGNTFSYGAGRLTADMLTNIRHNHYFKPTYFRPYYYITTDKIIIHFNKVDKVKPDTIDIEYLSTPTRLILTQDQLDSEEDTSSVLGTVVEGEEDTSSVLGTVVEDVYLEYPDYVQYEIINELVKLAMENSSDQRIQTHIGVNQSIASQQQQR